MAKSTKNKSSQFSIEMDFRGVLVMALLAILTGATIFYLGVVFGKASRNPQEALKIAQETGQAPEGEPPKDLKIYDLGTKGAGPSSLQSEFEAIKSKTDSLVVSEEGAVKREEENQNQIQANLATPPESIEAAKTEAAPAQAEAVKAEPTKPSESDGGISWPEVAEETSDKAGDLYTVQVLSTSQASKAKAIVAQLKNKGFDAYTEEIKLDNSQLFRVRVAKLSKEKIQAVREKLTKVVDGLGRLQVVKVSK